MKISTKGRYALRMLVDVAQHQSSGTVTLKEIAERQGISKKYLEQIALVLSQAGILRGARGHQGGVEFCARSFAYSQGRHIKKRGFIRFPRAFGGKSCPWRKLSA